MTLRERGHRVKIEQDSRPVSAVGVFQGLTERLVIGAMNAVDPFFDFRRGKASSPQIAAVADAPRHQAKAAAYFW